MKHRDVDTPEFDFGVPSPKDQTGGATCTQAGESPATSNWQEVPQARFLSWSRQMQAAYCANRDLASAETAAERGEDPEFYLERAEGYAVEALR